MALTGIFYDLETTDFDPKNQHRGVEIISIGAINGKTGEEYHKYMVPTCDIHPDASKVNGIEKDGDGLVLKGQRLKAGDPKEVLEDFMDWLDRQKYDFLVAHNNKKFDSVVLRNNLLKFGVKERIRKSQNEDSWIFMTELRSSKLHF